jgi:hypothetical protein
MLTADAGGSREDGALGCDKQGNVATGEPPAAMSGLLPLAQKRATG